MPRHLPGKSGCARWTARSGQQSYITAYIFNYRA
jgi:hypothetical protein